MLIIPLNPIVKSFLILIFTFQILLGAENIKILYHKVSEKSEGFEFWWPAPSMQSEQQDQLCPEKGKPSTYKLKATCGSHR